MQLLISDKGKNDQHGGTAEKVKHKNDSYTHVVKLVLGGHGFDVKGANANKVTKFFDDHKIKDHKPTDNFADVAKNQLQTLPLLVTEFVQEYKKITQRMPSTTGPSTSTRMAALPGP